MAIAYQLESSSDRYLLEDGSSLYLNEVQDVSVALTGESCTGATGLLKPDWHLIGQQGQAEVTLAIALTGQESTAATGTITADVPSDLSLALTGEASTFALGTLAPSNDLAATGQGSVSASGLLAFGSDAIMGGLETALALGDFMAAQGLAGQVITGEQGTVTQTGGTTPTDTDTFFDLRRRRRFGRSTSPLVTQWPPRRIR